MTEVHGRLQSALADRYRIEREIGAGGMATVYLAQDLRHDRKVALKLLRPELSAVIGAERFLAEIKLTANLQHPHILPLFDSGEADSFLFYACRMKSGVELLAVRAYPAQSWEPWTSITRSFGRSSTALRGSHNPTGSSSSVPPRRDG